MACRLVGILLIRTLRTKFGEILGETQIFSFKKMPRRNPNIFIQENSLENIVRKWRPFCLRLNVLIMVAMTVTIFPCPVYALCLPCTVVRFHQCITEYEIFTMALLSALPHLPPGQNSRNIGRQHFQMHFLEWKWRNSDFNFTVISSQGSNSQYPSIGSGNGLTPNRRQAIAWNNGDPVLWHIYMRYWIDIYRKTSSISRTKSQNVNVSCILLQLSSLNLLKPGVQLRMKM